MSSQTLRVIVDNSIGDPNILKYNGDWHPGRGRNGEHNRTTHETVSQGSSSTFNFYGSSVRLVGTLFNGHGTINLSNTIDSGSPSFSVFQEDLEDIYFEKTLFQEDVPEGKHSLMTTLESDEFTLSIDYFIYNTTLDHFLVQQKLLTVLVDDSDSRIVYSDSWEKFQSRPFTMDQTEHTTRSLGSTANFTFQGSYIAVYGTLLPRMARSTYTLDGGAPAVYDAPSSKTTVTAQRLFEQNIVDGEHTLVIKSVSEGGFSLDYITYKPSLSGVVSSLAPSSTIVPSSFPSTSNTDKTPAIVGGVVGSIVGLLTIVLVALFLRKRRRASVPQSTLDLSAHDPTFVNHVTPFLGGSTPTLSASSAVPRWSAPSRNPPEPAQDGGVRSMPVAEEEATHPPAYQSDYLTTRIKNW